MPENGITIRVLSQFGPDQKNVPQILNIINPAKIPCVDMPFCDDSIKRKIAEGGILVIENGSEQNKAVIGAILTHWIQKNNSGEFSIAFDKAVRNNREIIARTIDSFKNCAFNEMRLSLVTIIVSSDDSLPEILREKNFTNALDLTNRNYFSISNNGSKLTSLTENDHSAETSKPDGAEIKKLRLALEKSDEICRMAYSEIEKLKKENIRLNEESSKIAKKTGNGEPPTQSAELIKQRDEALKEKNKFKEWLEDKNRRLEEAQKTIAELRTELGKQGAQTTNNKSIAEKNPVKEKGSLADIKLVPKDLQILQIIIESGENGIFQQEIIKKTGSNQSDVSRAVRILDAKGLVKNQRVGIQSKAIAQIDQIRLQLPDMIKPMEQSEPEKDPPKDENEQHQPPEPEKTKPDKKPEPILMPLSDSSTDPESELLKSLPDNRIQQTKGYLNDCLEKDEEISLFVICSKAGVKKDQSELFVSALVKSMNKATSDPNSRVKAVKFSIDEDDFAKSTIKLLSEIELLSEFEKDKPPEKQPAETKPEESEEEIVTTDELKEKLRNGSNENGTNILEKPKRTLAQLLNTHGIVEPQRKMLEEINKAGGKISKNILHDKTKIKKSTFDLYLQYMEKDLGVIKMEGNIISLNL